VPLSGGARDANHTFVLKRDRVAPRLAPSMPAPDDRPILRACPHVSAFACGMLTTHTLENFARARISPLN
jgi:hypothetical protein